MRKPTNQEDGGLACLKAIFAPWHRQRAIKGAVGEGPEGCVDSSRTILELVGIKVQFQASPIFWFQLVGGLHI